MATNKRILIAKLGLDGHDRGARIVAMGLRDANFEVIYTGRRQSPAQVVAAAEQEDVDAIGISILSGAHMTLFQKIMELLKQKGMDDIPLFGGGIIPPEDAKQLMGMGVKAIYGPGSAMNDIVAGVTQILADKENA